MNKEKGKRKELPKEREEVIQFRKDLAEGKITSYDQFPEEFWGLGMLLGVSYLDEIEIFNKITNKGKEEGMGKDLVVHFFSEAKDMINHSREAEALIIAYWIGKIFGIYRRNVREDEVNKLMANTKGG
jgi:hypothetical protein